jgi:hypothetical protein
MTGKTPTENRTERRAEVRETLEKMKSLELKLPNLPIYVFKVKDTSSNGICFLIKGNSEILNYIRVGQILNVRYHEEDITKSSEICISEIKHITKMDKGPHKNRQLIGLMILENEINA